MLTSVCVNQCDQIWRFIALWATFQSHWQQLFCPNCPHILGNFVTQHLPTIGAISKTVLLHFRLSRYLTKSMDLHIYVSFDQKSVNMFDMVWNQLKIYSNRVRNSSNRVITMTFICDQNNKISIFGWGMNACVKVGRVVAPEVHIVHSLFESSPLQIIEGIFIRH